MTVVVALGGNALLRRGDRFGIEAQVANARRAAAMIRRLADHHDLVITHGNGPQVGLLALQSEALVDGPAVPLDVLGAESEGMIGYLLARELIGVLQPRAVVTVLTHTLVDASDPALEHPTKPIGPVYPRDRGERLAQERGWVLRPDGTGLRRVVGSPRPIALLEVASVRLLLTHGAVVICAGGGGIPVARNSDGGLRGVEGVVDKDAASALLARELAADFLLLLTDVDAVYEDWPERSRPIRRSTPDGMSVFRFTPGSMGPKVEAACAFARSGGRAAIGALDQAVEVLAGAAGTTIEYAEG